jgi:prepilin-type N-terminal cleavage/methylation domain-containing protein
MLFFIEISLTYGRRLMKMKRNGFTLIEMLMAIAVGAISIVGMLRATMAYMYIWKEVAGNEQKEKFNREIVTRKLLLNELATAVAKLDKCEGNPSLTFRKLNGEPAIVGDTEVCFYWESTNALPFLEQDQGGTTQCWLKFEKGNAETGPLKLYYRSLKPGEQPAYNDASGNATSHITLLAECKGINFGYLSGTDASLEFKYQNTPSFSNGKDPDLPGVIQFLLPN